MDWLQDSVGGLVATAVLAKKIPHKRVHWRVLVLPDSARRVPGHIVEVADGSLSLRARYTFPMGTRLQLAIFVPDPQDRSVSKVLQLGAKVSFQVMRGDEVQTGLQVSFPEAARQMLIEVLRQEI